jgi:excisionase family DNA binding protein
LDADGRVRIVTEWLTVKEAMAYLKVSRATIFSWCASGKLPFYKIDSPVRGGRRFKRQDLDALLKPGGPEPTGD